MSRGRAKGQANRDRPHCHPGWGAGGAEVRSLAHSAGGRDPHTTPPETPALQPPRWHRTGRQTSLPSPHPTRARPGQCELDGIKVYSSPGGGVRRQPLPTLSPGRTWTPRKPAAKPSTTYRFHDFLPRWSLADKTGFPELDPEAQGPFGSACAGQGAVASPGRRRGNAWAQAAHLSHLGGGSSLGWPWSALARGGARAGLHPPSSQARQLQGARDLSVQRSADSGASQPASLPSVLSQAGPPVALQGVHVVPSWE